MWKSQKKNKLGRRLLEPKWLKPNQTKGTQQTEQKATNASPSLKQVFNVKGHPLPPPGMRLYLPCKILTTIRLLSPHTNIQVARFSH